MSHSAPGRQAAHYALRGGRTAFFLILHSLTPPALAHDDVQGQQRLLQSAFADMGWECDAIIDAMRRCDDLYFDAVSQIHMERWSSGRVALVGDACACPSLLAGEGSSMAMAGAYVLAAALAAVPRKRSRAITRTWRP